MVAELVCQDEPYCATDVHTQREDGDYFPAALHSPLFRLVLSRRNSTILFNVTIAFNIEYMVKANSGVTDIQEYGLNELDASITLLYEFNDKWSNNGKQYMNVKRIKKTMDKAIQCCIECETL
jgi:hypothetical protein